MRKIYMKEIDEKIDEKIDEELLSWNRELKLRLIEIEKNEEKYKKER